jgi:hypothetical protein
MCGRFFCPVCKEEMIHRDHRHGWESASAFGQIVWRAGPKCLTTGDIDHYAAVFGKKTLFRLIEHKQPNQELKKMQEKVLLLLGHVIEHAVTDYPQGFDKRTGVFIVRGEVGAEATGLRRTHFVGPQKVSKVVGGKFITQGVLPDQESVFRWLEGTPVCGDRRAKILPQPTLLI